MSREVAQWLRTFRPLWTVQHTSEVGLQGKSDESIFCWVQQDGSLIITFDEDFADRRAFPLGDHHGVVRLRVWPTTIEEMQRALERLFAEVAEHELSGPSSSCIGAGFGSDRSDEPDRNAALSSAGYHQRPI